MNIANERPDMARRWLSFRLAGQDYAAPLAEVSEVIRPGPCLPVPGAAPDLIGIYPLRGRIVPVMDGRRRLGLPPAELGDDTRARVVVLNPEQQWIGLRVDAVGDLIDADPEAIAPPPADRERRADDPVCGVLTLPQAFIALLDVRRLCRLP